ncbi:MAG: hypothetical protein Q7K43_04315, partial [Candidatus Woesearchaeota archaeon]|nr:hypothetical protein [Candidatus Woesearchaeota archaeon]
KKLYREALEKFENLCSRFSISKDCGFRTGLDGLINTSQATKVLLGNSIARIKELIVLCASLKEFSEEQQNSYADTIKSHLINLEDWNKQVGGMLVIVLEEKEKQIKVKK